MKSYDQPRQHIKKQRHYFADKVHLVKAIVFPVVMYGCESWTTKKAEHRRIDALNCGFREDSWESLAKRSNQSIERNHSWIFIGRTDAEVEAPILWPPDAKSWLIRKDPDSGQDWSREEKGTTGWDGWMASLTQWTWVWARTWSWWSTGKPGVLQSMGLQRVGHDWATELNWSLFHSLYSNYHGRKTECTLPSSQLEVTLLGLTRWTKWGYSCE